MDPSSISGTESLFTYGPLGIAVAGLIWYIGVLLRERKEMVEAHKIELAAERKLNAELQDKRIGDLQVLIPLSQALRTSSDAHVTALANQRIKE